jgi:hypothetical protein
MDADAAAFTAAASASAAPRRAVSKSLSWSGADDAADGVSQLSARFYASGGANAEASPRGAGAAPPEVAAALCRSASGDDAAAVGTPGRGMLRAASDGGGVKGAR